MDTSCSPAPSAGQMVDLHKILAGENRLPVLPGKRIVRHEGGRADVSILVDVQHIAVLRRPALSSSAPEAAAASAAKPAADRLNETFISPISSP